jgi:hypothetical protein
MILQNPTFAMAVRIGQHHDANQLLRSLKVPWVLSRCVGLRGPSKPPRCTKDAQAGLPPTCRCVNF